MNGPSRTWEKGPRVKIAALRAETRFVSYDGDTYTRGKNFKDRTPPDAVHASRVMCADCDNRGGACPKCRAGVVETLFAACAEVVVQP